VAKRKVVPVRIPAMKEEDARALAKRLAEYARVLGDDCDCDWAPIARLLAYKLERTRDHLKKHNNFVGCEKVVAQIDETIAALGRIVAENYYQEELDALEPKYRKVRWICTKLPNGNTRLEFLPPKGVDAKTWEIARREALDDSHKAMKADLALAFGNMRDYLTGWWD